jgi:hypothetical protein
VAPFPEEGRGLSRSAWIITLMPLLASETVPYYLLTDNLCSEEYPFGDRFNNSIS